MKVPWDYSSRVVAGDPDATPNVPTDEGKALGRELARLCDVEEREQLKRFPNQLPRCDDCALRAGTLPNGCPSTMMDVLKCVAEAEPFYCHKGVRDEADPKRLCSGFMILVGVAAESENKLMRRLAEAYRAMSSGEG
jgi:hypothetical protein